MPPPGFATGAAHKPGALPLRPLRIGDMYDAAFKIIRFNPRATVGSAVLVAAVAMAIPVIVTAVLSLTVDLSLDPGEAGQLEPGGGADVAGLVGTFGAFALGGVAQSLGLILVTGMIAHVTMAAAVGRRLSLAEAWAATHGSRWRLIGLTILVGATSTVLIALYIGLWVVLAVASGEVVVLVLWGLVSVPLVVAGFVWAYVRLSYLSVPALMLESVGVFAALGRAFTLTRRQFWRTFGISVLTAIITQIAGGMLTFPITLVAQFSLLAPGLGNYQLLVFVVGQALATIIAAAFVSPFTAAVTSLQYVDQRMRKEAFDVELLARAGITTS